MSETLETIKAVCRVWKSGNKNAILIFPEDVNPRNYTVGMWEEIGQHGDGDPQSVVQRTRLATDEEAEAVRKMYERHYQCRLIMQKRMKINWRPAV